MPDDTMITEENERSIATRKKLVCVEREEELTWVRFYPEVRRDAMLAVQILVELERDEALRRRHRGLYLSCKRCIHAHERREATNQRLGCAARAALAVLFVRAPQAVLLGVRQLGQLLFACSPHSTAYTQHHAAGLLEGDAYALADPALRERARKAADKHDARPPGGTSPETRVTCVASVAEAPPTSG